MLNGIGELITKKVAQDAAGDASKKAVSKMVKSSVLDDIDDFGKVSLRDLLRFSGREVADNTNSVRTAVLDTLGDPKVDARIRSELIERTPFAARVWNNPNRINELPRYNMFRSNAVQSGADFSDIIQQYGDSEGGMSTITLSDLDEAFKGAPVYTGSGDLYSPYAEEGAGRTIQWVRENDMHPITRQDLRDKYWRESVAGLDEPRNVLSGSMRDYPNTRDTSVGYDEYLALARPTEALAETRKDFIPGDGNDWQYAEEVADKFKQQLLKRFLMRDGRGRTLLEKAVPSVALGLGGLSMLGNNKNERN